MIAWLGVALVLLAGCGPVRPLVVEATPTPASPQYCALRVNGRVASDARGGTVVLHGATLPTLREMRAAGEDPAALLRALARAGAGVVRLPIDEDELTPTFVPAELSPFVDAANAQGLLVILAFRNDPSKTERKQAETSDDWLRLMLTYLRFSPGVWLEPYATAPDSPKWREMAQRSVDVARGLGSPVPIVIAEPRWLLQGEPPLLGENVAYISADAQALPRYAEMPILLLALTQRSAVPGDTTWLIAPESALVTLWDSSRQRRPRC